MILPSEAEAQTRTAGWKLFEDPALGLRFRYPPEYEVRIQAITARKTGISIDRPAKDPIRGEYREGFIGLLLFSLRPEDPRPLTPEALEAWVQKLPAEENPIPGGGPIRVVESIRVGEAPGFVIMEPLWPGDPPNVQSLVIVGRERLLWIALGDINFRSPERTEALWPLQMAFLRTLELTR